MQIIEIPLTNIAWPKCCCRCGREAYSIRTHAEDVVVWTVLGVTASRRISLPLPVCTRCAFRHIFWYTGAVAAGGLGLLAGDWLDKSHSGYSGWVFGIGMMSGIGLALAGLRSLPINILGYNADSGILKLRIKNDAAAAALLRNPGSRTGVHKAVRRSFLIWLLVAVVVFIAAVVAMPK